MKLAKNIGYWGTTGLLTLAMAASAFGYLSGAMDEAMGSAGLGYPAVFITILGVAKALGAIGLIVPALPRVKEWVYAGFTFVFIGAAWSHIAVDGVGHAVPPIVMLVLLAASYALRPERLWVGGSPFGNGQSDASATRQAAAV
jgi:uncharacterized membrane protein YphA (DoxX/SURF4 family)